VICVFLAALGFTLLHVSCSVLLHNVEDLSNLKEVLIVATFLFLFCSVLGRLLVPLRCPRRQARLGKMANS
jgi:hypothetical protein